MKAMHAIDDIASMWQVKPVCRKGTNCIDLFFFLRIITFHSQTTITIFSGTHRKFLKKSIAFSFQFMLSAEHTLFPLELCRSLFVFPAYIFTYAFSRLPTHIVTTRSIETTNPNSHPVVCFYDFEKTWDIRSNLKMMSLNENMLFALFNWSCSWFFRVRIQHACA